MDKQTEERFQKESDDKLVLHEEIKRFMATSLYEKFMDSVDKEAALAVDVLKNADPYQEPRKILMAQEVARFHEKFRDWLIRAVFEGEQVWQIREAMEKQQEGQE